MCKDLLSSVVETDFFELINYSVLSEEAQGVMRVSHRSFFGGFVVANRVSKRDRRCRKLTTKEGGCKIITEPCLGEGIM